MGRNHEEPIREYLTIQEERLSLLHKDNCPSPTGKVVLTAQGKFFLAHSFPAIGGSEWTVERCVEEEKWCRLALKTGTSPLKCPAYYLILDKTSEGCFMSVFLIISKNLLNMNYFGTGIPGETTPH